VSCNFSVTIFLRFELKENCILPLQPLRDYITWNSAREKIIFKSAEAVLCDSLVKWLRTPEFKPFGRARTLSRVLTSSAGHGVDDGIFPGRCSKTIASHLRWFVVPSSKTTVHLGSTLFSCSHSWA
jgi:hypothetical protein